MNSVQILSTSLISGLEGKEWGDVYEKVHIQWPGALSDQVEKPKQCVKTTELRSLGIRRGEHRTVVSDFASAAESSMALSKPLGFLICKVNGLDLIWKIPSSFVNAMTLRYRNIDKAATELLKRAEKGEVFWKSNSMSPCHSSTETGLHQESSVYLRT